jgi:hypothetical protein
MGRTTNLTFSREKDRELSYFESKVGSIKRRFSNSITRKKYIDREDEEIVTEESSVGSGST